MRDVALCESGAVPRAARVWLDLLIAARKLSRSSSPPGLSDCTIPVSRTHCITMPLWNLSQFIRGMAAACATLLALGLTGCATTTATTGKLHAAAPAQIASIRTTAVVPPQIVLNQLTAGGVKEQRDDWTNTARQAARETLESIRPERIIYLRDTQLEPAVLTEIDEIQALYRAVDLNLTFFGNPMVGLPTMAGRFDFSVGSVDKVCEAAGADALLLVYGEDDYFTGDRKALAALIARDGTLLWYDSLGAGRLGDLRKPEGVRATLENLLRSMPGGITSTP